MMADVSKQPLVRLCSYCQKEFGLEDSMKKAAKEGVRFTHGMCLRHFESAMRAGGFEDAQIKSFTDKHKADPKNQPPPDLEEKPDLVKLYKQGIWLPQQIQQPEVKPITESFQNRLKKLAGIKS